MLRFLDPGRRVWEGEDILEETEDEIARRGGRGWGAVAVAGACAGVVSWTVSRRWEELSFFWRNEERRRNAPRADPSFSFSFSFWFVPSRLRSLLM